jgi:hypothetical protein
LEEWPAFPEQNVMATDGKRRPPAKAAPAADRAADRMGQRAKPAAERPFDMWLQKQLHAMYDEIASEPLPNDLMRMIDRDAATGEVKDDSDKPSTDGNDKKS